MEFTATIELAGKTATGFEVPADVVTALGSGKRPKVVVTIGGYSYRSTVAVMGGRFMMPLNAENRAAAGVAAGDQVEIDLELDTAPRDVVVPDDLAAVIAADAVAAATFDKLAFTHRREYVRWIEDAKKPETRQRRLDQAATMLREGKTR